VHSRPADKPVVLVTGSSRGIGRAIAAGFGSNGYRVAANYRIDTVGALDTTRTIETYGGEAFAHQADVRDAKAVHAMVSTIMARWGRLDVLVCNAGVTAHDLVMRLSEESWTTVLGTVLTGTFHCLQTTGLVMKQQGGGAILLIGSLASIQGRPGQAPYAAAKAGLIGLMHTAAREWGRYGIRINMVFPGWHATALTQYQEDSTPPPFAPVLETGTKMEAVAQFVCALAKMPDISGQAFSLDSRILPL
jgi:3-oxoacyl-[acyl-carrier protein] reductase